MMFILIGIGFNFFVYRAQINYHIKHLKVCLTDLNENALKLVSQNIEMQRKQDRINKLILTLFLVLGFILLIAIFMNAFG